MEVDAEGGGGGNYKSLTWQRALVEFDNQVIKVCGRHSSTGGQWQQLWGDSTLTPAASLEHLAEDEHAIEEMDWGEAALFRWPYMMYWTPPATLLPPLLDSIFLLLQPVRGGHVGALLEAGPHGGGFCSVNKRRRDIYRRNQCCEVTWCGCQAVVTCLTPLLQSITPSFSSSVKRFWSTCELIMHPHWMQQRWAGRTRW